MKFLKTASFILALTLSFTACQNENNSAGAEASNLNAESEGTSFVVDGAIVDDEGRSVSVEKPFERIISLYSAHTENLYYLGAGDKIIGGHKTCVYPAEAASKASFDYNGDPEYIIAADPDLVIIRPFISKKAPELVKALETAGIQVASFYPESYDEFPDYIRRLSLLVGKEEEAEKQLAKFDSHIESIKEAVKDIEDKQTVFFESTETNLRTAAKDSMPDIAIRYAGGINIAEGLEPVSPGSSIASFGVERVLENADNIDVYVSQRGAMNAGGSVKAITERPGFDSIKAVADNRIFVINEKIISSPTFRYYKGVKEIARYLYPEKMDDVSQLYNDEPATNESFAEIVVKMSHAPIYIPSSSKYYQEEKSGHYFGKFEDVSFKDDSFDFIETAVCRGLIPYETKDGKDYFNPERNVSRDVLAKTVFLMGNFKNNDKNIPIEDIKLCENEKIVSVLVDNGVFALNEGRFEPQRTVTNKEIIDALKNI